MPFEERPWNLLDEVLAVLTSLLPEEISVRLKKLWERRLASIKAAATAPDHAAELAAFGWWFVSRKFDDAWAMSQLLAVFSLAQKAEPDYIVVERLVTLAA